jgi:hypothetical protein
MRIQDLVTEHKDNMADFIAAMEDFLPLVMKELELESLPTIKLKKHIKDSEQPTFGKYVNDKYVLFVGIKDRHIIDVLRTIAHELVHYKQDIENRLHLGAGETGSDIENEANKMAGIIMRKFNKAHRHYFEKPALDLMESKRKKKKKRPQKRSPTFRGLYGYYGDFSDNSGGDAGGDVAESWSKKYKKSINCDSPKGFSQRAHCQGRKKRKTTESVSVAKVHRLANKKGIPWDNNKRFMRKTRELTGKRHLDDLSQSGLKKVINWLKSVNENFADGKKPGRKGLSKRVGIPKKTTLAQLKKIASTSTGERRRMAQWQLNMRRGRNKKK